MFAKEDLTLLHKIMKAKMFFLYYPSIFYTNIFVVCIEYNDLTQ